MSQAQALFIHCLDLNKSSSNCSSIDKCHEQFLRTSIQLLHKKNDNQVSINGAFHAKILSHNISSVQRKKLHTTIEFQPILESIVSCFHNDICLYTIENDNRTRQLCRILQQLYDALDWHGMDMMTSSFDSSNDKKTFQRLVYVLLPSVEDKDEVKIMIELLTKLRLQWTNSDCSANICITVIDTSTTEIIASMGQNAFMMGENAFNSRQLGVVAVSKESSDPVHFDLVCKTELRLLKSANDSLERRDCVESIPLGCYQIRNDIKESKALANSSDQLPPELYHYCLVPMNSFKKESNSERVSFFIKEIRNAQHHSSLYNMKIISLLMEGSDSCLILSDEKCRRFFYLTSQPLRNLDVIMNEMDDTQIILMHESYSCNKYVVPFEFLLDPSQFVAERTKNESVSIKRVQTVKPQCSIASKESSKRSNITENDQEQIKINSTKDFERYFRICIYDGHPKPTMLARDIFPTVFCTIFSKNTQQLYSSQIYRTVDEIKELLIKRDESEYDNDTCVRVIQIQVLMRLQILVLSGKEPLDQSISTDCLIKKGKSRRKKDKSVSSFIDQLFALLTQAAFHMSPDSIANFLADTLITPYASLFPNIVTELYDRFELTPALPEAIKKRIKDRQQIKTRKSTIASKHLYRSNSTSSLTTLLEKRRVSDNVESQCQKGKGKAVQTEREPSIFRSSVSLVGKNLSRNPMLKSGQRRYIGGHFTDKLSNVSELFREVKQAPSLLPRNRAQSEKSSKSSNTSKSSRSFHNSPHKRKAHARFIEPCRNISFSSPQKKSRKANSAMVRKFNQRVIRETPMKDRLGIGSTPEKSPGIRAPVRSILDEVSQSRKRRASTSASRNSLFLDSTFSSNR